MQKPNKVEPGQIWKVNKLDRQYEVKINKVFDTCDPSCEFEVIKVYFDRNKIRPVGFISSNQSIAMMLSNSVWEFVAIIRSSEVCYYCFPDHPFAPITL